MRTDNLRSIGIEPDDIDTMLMTHLHPDHVNGLIDDYGQAVCPKVELVVNEAELVRYANASILPSHPVA
jgi:metal-dependent hydrolase (beta-lactamase superfamily II)